MNSESLSIPARMADRPRVNGEIVPWYALVDDEDGQPSYPWQENRRDFVVSRRRQCEALAQFRCPACGEKLGRYVAFALNVEEVLRGVTSWPPCHVDCALYLAQWRTRNLETEQGNADIEESEVAPQLRAVWEVESGNLSYRMGLAEGGRLAWVDLFPGEARAAVAWHGPYGVSPEELRAAVMAEATRIDEEAARMNLPHLNRTAIQRALERRISRILGEWGTIALPADAEA